LSPPAKILELGVGTGELALRLSDRGFSVIGVDVSPHMIKKAKKKILKYDADVKIYKGRIEKKIFGHRFDAVVSYGGPLFVKQNKKSIDILFYTICEEVEEIVRSIKNNLKDNGLFVCNIENTCKNPEIYKVGDLTYVRSEYNKSKSSSVIEHTLLKGSERILSERYLTKRYDISDICRMFGEECKYHVLNSIGILSP